MSQSDTESHTDTPTRFTRDENGLVVGLSYVYDESGRVNWKAMINPNHIVFSDKKNEKLAAEITTKYGAPVDQLVYAEVIKKQPVDDNHVLVLLAGFTELADLRGYCAVNPQIVHVTPGSNVTCQVTIDWIPNQEEPEGKTSFGTADATMENTGGFGYLAAVAGNRAFVRAVRHGLRIPILGADELAKKDAGAAPVEGGSTTSVAQSLSPQGVLQSEATKFGATFEKVKAAAIAKLAQLKLKSDPATWTKYEDVPPPDCMTIITHLRQGKTAKAQDAKAA